jgi:hypothetical protein
VDAVITDLVTELGPDLWSVDLSIFLVFHIYGLWDSHMGHDAIPKLVLNSGGPFHVPLLGSHGPMHSFDEDHALGAVISWDGELIRMVSGVSSVVQMTLWNVVIKRDEHRLAMGISQHICPALLWIVVGGDELLSCCCRCQFERGFRSLCKVFLIALSVLKELRVEV